MPARTSKERGKTREVEPLDAITPDMMATACAPPREGANQAPLATAPPPADQADGSVPGSPARQLLEAQAARLDERAWGLSVYASLAPLFGPGVEVFAYKLFLDRFLTEIAPSGPIERMLSEQLFLSHHIFGHLSVKAMGCGNADAAKVYLSAAARLLCEFRQSAVVFKGFRTTPPAPSSASGSAKPPEPELPKVQSHDPVVEPEDSPPWTSELRSNRLRGLFDEPVEQSA